jgi:hypothetical protein
MTTAKRSKTTKRAKSEPIMSPEQERFMAFEGIHPIKPNGQVVASRKYHSFTVGVANGSNLP